MSSLDAHSALDFVPRKAFVSNPLRTCFTGFLLATSVLVSAGSTSVASAAITTTGAWHATPVAASTPTIGLSTFVVVNGRPLFIGVDNTGTEYLSRNALTWTAAGPASAPGVPVITSVVAGSKQLTVTWTDGASNGSALTTRTVTYSATGQPTVSVNVSSGNSLVITKLIAGLSYSVSVKDTNAVGSSTSVAVKGTPTA